MVILGRAGRNFAAGMSGGIVYAWDIDGDFKTRCNMGAVELFAVEEEKDIEEFLIALRGVMPGDKWDAVIPTLDYKKINPTKIAESCDALVLSPGDALVGLLDYDRASRDPQIGPLYILIQAAIIQGNVSV